MGIRKILREKPWVGTVLALVLLAGAGVVVFTAGTGQSRAIADQAFFTIDDGATTFTDARSQVPPFQREGKEAVKVNMFSCDGGSTSFVGYLQKYTDADKKAFETAVTAGPQRGGPSQLPMTYLVKKPGGSKWFNNMSPEGKEVMKISCDSGYPEIYHP